MSVRIAYVISTLDRCGPVNVLHDIVRRLAPDHELAVFTLAAEPAAAALASEGVRGFDLMGAHSARCPELFRVGKYKIAFASHFTDVPGGWEMPVKRTTYRSLRTAMSVKRRMRRS